MYFTNSGGEANELAMMMARVHTGAFDIITLRYIHVMDNVEMILLSLGPGPLLSTKQGFRFSCAISGYTREDLNRGYDTLLLDT